MDRYTVLLILIAESAVCCTYIIITIAREIQDLRSRVANLETQLQKRLSELEGK